MTSNAVAFLNAQTQARKVAQDYSIARAELAETKRSNVAKEALQQSSLEEQIRANKRKEYLTSQSNYETQRSNLAREAETLRSNRAREAETQRHNTNSVILQKASIIGQFGIGAAKTLGDVGKLIIPFGTK